MVEQLKRLLAWFNSQTMPFKVGLVGGSAVLLVGLITVVAVSLTTSFEPLYYNLNSDDAADVVEFLKKERIPYKLVDQGRIIEVPRKDVYEVRLQLVGSAMPRGGVGFEIFDKSNLGVTEFVQNINYQRALQGELARTIREISQVESARVHLVIPKKSLFIEEQKESTASVILKLKQGRVLRKEQVEGVMNLVAGSVEGLQPEQVTVLDARGVILSQDVVQAVDDNSLTAKQISIKREYEHNLEKRLQTMLERVVGMQKVVVRVAAPMDFSKVEKTEELFDPDMTAVRSEHLLSVENQEPAAAGQGVPGVAANIPEQAATAEMAVAGKSSSAKNDQTRNYEVSKTVSHTQLPIGSVKNISVAVLVDGIYKEVGKNQEPEFMSRADDELLIYANMVKKAIGFNKKRGDQVEVACVAFDTASLADDLKAMKNAERLEMIKVAGKYLLLLLILLVVYAKVVKPLLAFVSQQMTAGKPAARKPGMTTMAEEVTERVEIKKERTIMDQIGDFAKENPDEVARIVKIWLKEQTS
ncbi:MAG: flagellar M-ring protein FliF [Deltaproteobacteria bacterium]|nr:flagellar M-ring protein FliF [Candidatus Anaeroferrophillus wilburensis]MBN2888483.1 flagellar M-ring protein FliF [Deltaproteobacteria bacterium]